MVADHLRTTLGARVELARSAAEAIEHDLNANFDLLVVDVALPDGNGLDLIRILAPRQSCIAVVISGAPTLGRAIEAMRAGARDFFVKPFDLARMTTVLGDLLNERHTLTRERRRLQRLDHLVRKVMDERKVLQNRVDLVCRDLVGAYRDLAERFTKLRS